MSTTLWERVPGRGWVGHVPRRSDYDSAAVDSFLRQHEYVATHTELMQLGVPRSTIVHRIGPHGPWQRLLPGVVLAHRGRPTAREQRISAQKYGGAASVITGRHALDQHRVLVRRLDRVHLLVPHSSHKTSHHFVTVERTRKCPEPVISDRLRLAPIPRAVVDACRRDEPLDDVRALVAQVVQSRRCTPQALGQALTVAARQRTSGMKQAMREIDVGTRSVAEADAHLAMQGSGLPPLEWNVELWTPQGELIGIPDGWYDDVALALQIDSMEWHLSPELYKRTQRLQREMTSRGIVVLPYAPSDIGRDPRRFVTQLEITRREAGKRPRPPDIIVRRQHQS